jgi:signal peptidase II
MVSRSNTKVKVASFGLIGLVVALDQISKQWARGTLRFEPPKTYWHDIVRIQYAENVGAFLGLGNTLTESQRFWIFTFAVAVFLIFAFRTLLVGSSRSSLWSYAMALLIAGGLGNLIDRFQFHFVTDFLNLGFGSLRTGIFNIADLAIVFGAAVFVFAQDRSPIV